MLRDLRDPEGGPNLATRVAAVLVVLAMVVVTAPVVALPLVRAAGRLLF